MDVNDSAFSRRLRRDGKILGIGRAPSTNGLSAFTETIRPAKVHTGNDGHLEGNYFQSSACRLEAEKYPTRNIGSRRQHQLWFARSGFANEEGREYLHVGIVPSPCCPPTWDGDSRGGRS
jgi:hypothetical protein